MKIKRPTAYYAYLCLFLSSASFANCDFDTDDADAPDFMDKIIACEEQQQQQANRGQPSQLVRPNQIVQSSSMATAPLTRNLE